MRFFGYATGMGEIAPLPGGIAMYSGLEYGVFNIAMLDGRVISAPNINGQRVGTPQPRTLARAASR